MTSLADRDFDAYAPAKWRSNVYNRERLDVKQKLAAIARAASPALTGLDGAPLVLEESTEHPALWNHKQVDAQHVFFSRPPAARRELDARMERARALATLLDDPTPQRNHLHLALSLAEGGLDVALRLSPDAAVDRENLEAKLADPDARAYAGGLVAALPPGFRLDVVAASGRLVCVSLARALSRAAALALGDGLAPRVAADLAALLPLYTFGAWAPANDFVSMRASLAEDKRARRQRGLAKDDTVKIVRGLMAGRTGVVMEIDARGGLRVLVGKVAVKLGADEVEKT